VLFDRAKILGVLLSVAAVRIAGRTTVGAGLVAGWTLASARDAYDGRTVFRASSITDRSVTCAAGSLAAMER
jgi:hypothetical protein